MTRSYNQGTKDKLGGRRKGRSSKEDKYKNKQKRLKEW